MRFRSLINRPSLKTSKFHPRLPDGKSVCKNMNLEPCQLYTVYEYQYRTILDMTYGRSEIQNFSIDHVSQL
jgi:hypothetical protein